MSCIGLSNPAKYLAMWYVGVLVILTIGQRGQPSLSIFGKPQSLVGTKDFGIKAF